MCLMKLVRTKRLEIDTKGSDHWKGTSRGGFIKGSADILYYVITIFLL